MSLLDPDHPALAALRSSAASNAIGREIVVLRETRSTNDLALRAGVEGAAEGLVFTAEEQSAGRGRVPGRRWESAPSENLLFSLLLRPAFDPADWPRIALVAALATAESAERFAPVQARIKWPNDVLVEGRKLCGILVESRIHEAVVIVGVGWNIHSAPGPEAAALREWMREEPVREEILADWLDRFGVFYERMQAAFPVILQSIEARNALLASTVMLDGGRTGTVCGLGADGALLLRRGDGIVESVRSGEVREIRRIQ